MDKHSGINWFFIYCTTSSYTFAYFPFLSLSLSPPSSSFSSYILPPGKGAYICWSTCEVGAWGCFDKFNRLEERMLSAVSQQNVVFSKFQDSWSPRQQDSTLLQVSGSGL